MRKMVECILYELQFKQGKKTFAANCKGLIYEYAYVHNKIGSIRIQANKPSTLRLMHAKARLCKYYFRPHSAGDETVRQADKIKGEIVWIPFR